MVGRPTLKGLSSLACNGAGEGVRAHEGWQGTQEIAAEGLRGGHCGGRVLREALCVRART